MAKNVQKTKIESEQVVKNNLFENDLEINLKFSLKTNSGDVVNMETSNIFQGALLEFFIKESKKDIETYVEMFKKRFLINVRQFLGEHADNLLAENRPTPEVETEPEKTKTIEDKNLIVEAEVEDPNSEEAALEE